MPRPSRGRQNIPRPSHAEPGGPPAWSVAPPEARERVTVERVRAALAKAGPEVAWPRDPYPGARPAAVLVPLFEEEGEARVILTRRAAHMRSHTGEVSFPGGRLEAGEEAVAAALREACEEIGIEPEAVEVIGELAPLATFSSNSAITPVVGVLAARPALHPNPAEVEIVFDVSLAELMVDDVFVEEQWRWPGADELRPMPFFHLEEDIVWGATARMLHELLELVAFADG